VAELTEYVLTRAGALPHDSVDERLVAECRTKTGEAGAKSTRTWETPAPDIAAAQPPSDKDFDGMPDSWETAHGLNRNDPKDAPQDRDGDGYTNIEEYLNSFYVQQHPSRRVKPKVRSRSRRNAPDQAAP
jgi:hypothetical protein